MRVADLLNEWESNAAGELTRSEYKVRLPVEDAARLAALSEMFPRRSIEQLITDLLSAALSELERGMPYVEGAEVVSEDEDGNPIYGDSGPTPRFLSLTQKHLAQLKAC